MSSLRRWRGERGATLVETAIVLPVIMLILFGVIEYSSAYNDSSAVADAVRAGGRIGSTEAKNVNFATDTAAAVASALKTMPKDQPQELWIYKANNLGFPGASGNSSFSTCTSSISCIKYTWNQTTSSWTLASGGWTASTQQTCGTTAEQIGVWLKIRHPFVTGLFGTTLTLTDSSVFRFEPTTDCS